MIEQSELFGTATSWLNETPASFLEILHNDEITDCDWKTLISPDRYDELYIVSYVSSPRFFFNLAVKFKKTVLILGIEDGGITERFAELASVKDALTQERLEFFKGMDDAIFESLRDGKIEIRYAKGGWPIHSKLYILRKEGYPTRVLVGSANLTSNALSNKKQFEDLVCYDENYNASFVRNYERRFADIRKYSEDFVPESVRQIEKTNVFVVTDEVLAESVLEAAENIVGIGPDMIERLQEQIPEAVRQVEYQRTILETAADFLKAVTKKHRGGIAIVSKSTLAKKIPIIIKRAKIGHEETVEQGFFYAYSDTEQSLLTSVSGSETLTRCEAFDNSESVGFYLDKLDAFMETYRRFTVSNEDDLQITQRSVFDTILYAFMSPFIWKIREECIEAGYSPHEMADIPPFCVIAGPSGTGKTSLMTFINILMTGERRIAYHRFEQLSPDQIASYLYSENLFPLFLDEIANKFFNSTARLQGERFIKDFANGRFGKHPCLIGTTNMDSLLDPQAAKRLYYTHIRDAFDKDNFEAKKRFYEILDSLDNKLFQDFCWRISEKLKNGERLFSESPDFLFKGREIFRSYYQEAGRSIPGFIGKGRLDAYYDRGRFLWKIKYDTCREAFRESDEYIDVDYKMLFGNSYADKDMRKLLPSDVLKEGAANILKRQKFLEFIGAKCGHQTWLYRMRKFFGVS